MDFKTKLKLQKTSYFVKLQDVFTVQYYLDDVFTTRCFHHMIFSTCDLRCLRSDAFDNDDFNVMFSL